MKTVRLPDVKLEDFRKELKDYYYVKVGKHSKRQLCIDDECLIEEGLYHCDSEMFKDRGTKLRNDDFQKSQIQENRLLNKIINKLNKFDKE